VLPVAHNAGEYWPRHSWIKWPGTIRVVIGKPIDPKGKEPAEIIDLVKDWIVSTGEDISDPQQLKNIGIS
jgi:1-acyl-sn-glycerol-3-phosphate acyltransferase